MEEKSKWKITIYMGRKGIFKIATVIYINDMDNETFYFDNNPVVNLHPTFSVHYVFSLSKKTLNKKVCKLTEKLLKKIRRKYVY